MLALGPVVGFLGTGFFSMFGAMLAELYPTALRGTGLGFVYNLGRGVSSLAPFAVGYAADSYGIGAALGLNEALGTLEGVEGVGVARFAEKDVVRHPLVARIVAAYNRQNK